MPEIRRITILALLAAALVGAPSFGQTVIGGATPGGAFYTIAMPPLWNGDLVIWNHGFDLNPIAPGPDLGPLAELQLAEGYAIAASSYRTSGWALFDVNEDLEQTYEAFMDSFGPPNQVLLFGASLGGIVTARAVEEAELGNVVGALPICGALGGSRNWDAGIDLRLLYDFLCGDVPGANIPGAAKGLPLGTVLTPTEVATAANACFAHDFPAAARSANQQARLDKFLEITQIPQGFINTDIVFATLGMADLVHDPNKLGGRIGTGNRNVDYGDAEVNAGIQRVGASKNQRRLLRTNFTPRGNVGDVKIVSIHTDKDGLILVENESEYASVVPPGNLTTGIVQEAVPSHCGFSTSELVAAWESLRGWVAGDPQPSPFFLQFTCLALQPTFGGECRYNPFFQIPDMDGRIRPRNPGRTTRVRAAKVASPAAVASSPEAPAEAPTEAAILPEEAPAAELSPGQLLDSYLAVLRGDRIDRLQR